MTGTTEYQKLYSKAKCGRIVIDPTEAHCYYASFDNLLAIADINCGNGDMLSYYESSEYTIQERKFTMSISPTGNSIFMAGSIFRSVDSLFYNCRYNVNNSTEKIQ